jgi:hypothetical protein
MASTEPRSSLIREGLLAWPDGPAMRVRVTLLGVPAQFAADTLAREGEAAWAWLARLPELVGELCARWGLRVTGDPMHGYMALVVPVLRGDSRYALKVSWIDGETLNEAAALALWNGGGAVRLLDADDAAGALLLEWLDPRRTPLPENCSPTGTRTTRTCWQESVTGW